MALSEESIRKYFEVTNTIQDRSKNLEVIENFTGRRTNSTDKPSVLQAILKVKDKVAELESGNEAKFSTINANNKQIEDLQSRNTQLTDQNVEFRQQLNLANINDPLPDIISDINKLLQEVGEIAEIQPYSYPTIAALQSVLEAASNKKITDLVNFKQETQISVFIDKVENIKSKLVSISSQMQEKFKLKEVEQSVVPNLDGLESYDKLGIIEPESKTIRILPQAELGRVLKLAVSLNTRSYPLKLIKVPNGWLIDRNSHTDFSLTIIGDQLEIVNNSQTKLYFPFNIEQAGLEIALASSKLLDNTGEMSIVNILNTYPGLVNIDINLRNSILQNVLARFSNDENIQIWQEKDNSFELFKVELIDFNNLESYKIFNLSKIHNLDLQGLGEFNKAANSLSNYKSKNREESNNIDLEVKQFLKDNISSKILEDFGDLNISKEYLLNLAFDILANGFNIAKIYPKLLIRTGYKDIRLLDVIALDISLLQNRLQTIEQNKLELDKDLITTYVNKVGDIGLYQKRKIRFDIVRDQSKQLENTLLPNTSKIGNPLEIKQSDDMIKRIKERLPGFSYYTDTKNATNFEFAYLENAQVKQMYTLSKDFKDPINASKFLNSVPYRIFNLGELVSESDFSTANTFMKWLEAVISEFDGQIRYNGNLVNIKLVSSANMFSEPKLEISFIDSNTKSTTLKAKEIDQNSRSQLIKNIIFEGKNAADFIAEGKELELKLSGREPIINLSNHDFSLTQIDIIDTATNAKTLAINNNINRVNIDIPEVINTQSNTFISNILAKLNVIISNDFKEDSEVSEVIQLIDQYAASVEARRMHNLGTEINIKNYLERIKTKLKNQ